MKVEVDADELCELRKKVKGITGFVKIQPPEIITLMPADFVDKIKKLEEERDWWSWKARKHAGWLDVRNERLGDKIALKFGWGRDFVNVLIAQAQIAGYDAD